MSPGQTVDKNATILAGAYRAMIDMVMAKRISRHTLSDVVSTLKSVTQELERVIADTNPGEA